MSLSTTARVVALSALATLATAACAPSGSDVEHARSDITSVDQSKVKRQSIGNCWVYAAAGWMESLHHSATDREIDLSESYLTYWHWFDEITSGQVKDDAIDTGGDFGTAAEVVGRYGVMMEADFLPEEAGAEMSARQESALAAMNLSLRSGALSDPARRTDRQLVRRELDRAFGLEASLTQRLDEVFGPDVERTFDDSFDAFAAAEGTGIIPSLELDARLRKADTGEFYVGSIAEAFGLGGATSAWGVVDYPTEASERRAFWKRVQAALHDRQPVILSWFVDFNALRRDARFSKAELERRGPGSQGGHMTVMHDYQAVVPGVGLLEAGKQATAEQMTAALGDATTIEFVRVKNSWGGIRPERWDDAVLPGYHDIELGYLDGPIAACDPAVPTRCTEPTTPMLHVVLPAGY